MYADRYHSTASRPAGAGAALLISGAMILGLYYAGPTIMPGSITTVLTGRNIPLPEPTPPKPKPQPPAEQAIKSRTTPPITQPDPRVVLPPTGPAIGTTPDPGPVTFDPPGDPGPASGGITVDPPRAPVLVSAAVDPRYADALQPPYPPSAIRGGIEGSVKVRALIGVDGRVKVIEVVKSPNDVLADATRRHALARWRFKPATRDGIPVEGWKTMTMRFQIVE
ncbi:TonB family protein [Sphingomonas sp. BT-65]|uniref:energy transducer TonB n=1 Tax=Sphingomonas sp. BT-65 TaxID=2989821 RepID=UPI002235FD8D|nr:energy transducer TonB [Sphingomonas sp. BT-65]MCW4462252.1 TonB family protein [Sphingomonas sp. BT-65]